MFLRFFLLAITFLFISCADFERDNPEDQRSINFREPSSSSKQNSSSSVASSAPSSSSKQSSSSSVASSAPSSNSKQSSSSITAKSSSSSVTIINACPNVATGNNAMSCGGQIYKTVKIGDQVWMAENLNYDVEGSKCYDNDPANCVTYGKLYSWESAIMACPDGWHLPSDEEWTTLTNFVDSSTAGIILKANSDLWLPSNSTKGTDDYGFAALPGGTDYSGDSRGLNETGYWWSSTTAFGRRMAYTEKGVLRHDFGTRVYMLSIRCVKN